MNKSFTRESLLRLSEHEVENLKGLDVVITKCNGEIIESTIDRIMLAANEPHLPCGFVLLNKIEVGFDSIRRMDVAD
ncbi:MAG: hypothetical protein K2O01_03260 [Bacteroidales bacterium]|nr:hypothetical protein [Bacteroidales bacterium]